LDRVGFFDDLAQYIKGLLFIVTLASAENQPRSTPDISLILLGPIEDL
jgi:hypothetical protein